MRPFGEGKNPFLSNTICSEVWSNVWTKIWEASFGIGTVVSAKTTHKAGFVGTAFQLSPSATAVVGLGAV